MAGHARPLLVRWVLPDRVLCALAQQFAALVPEMPLEVA